MSILDMITGNRGLVPLAAGKLKSLFEEKGLKAIVILPNPDNEESMLPGFDILQYEVPIVCVDTTAYSARKHLDETHPYRLTFDEFDQYQRWKDNYDLELLNLKSTENG